ncbi:hypothetical protein DUZ99_04405 [Xylanibacillus composti]|uniref:Type II secretion system F family protein n=1 Tax=Xylanibacillus composti TaxID=1572762 RepID=A0A8J4H488_9BACL|nr:type II secretion system F family protein [Xylanibacillus composti]MDT9724230.1 hypothetical protein [Xylanibacillus composti]GIQ68253.1 type II secretion system F family protein [Xylanibacillus composti]
MIRRWLDNWEQAVYRRMMLLYDVGEAHQQSKQYARQKLRLFALAGVTGIVLYIASGFAASLLAIAAAVLALLPMLALKSLDQRIAHNRRALRIELPLVLSKLTLMLEAGETLRKALATCAQKDAADRQGRSLLRDIMQEAHHRMDNGASFTESMDWLARRCSVQEVSLFVHTLMLHQRRGGSELAYSLQTLAVKMWEERKLLARTLGEEASSKLLFPMLLIFVAVLLIVGAPAVMMMQGGGIG